MASRWGRWLKGYYVENKDMVEKGKRVAEYQTSFAPGHSFKRLSLNYTDEA